LKSKDEVFEHF
jgi:hypothetical protein